VIQAKRLEVDEPTRSLSNVKENGSAVTRSLTRQIAQGLADLHALGLVHRDLKSANVLIGNGGTKVVKIIDLGLLRVRRAPTIANDGTARGTLHYMSPKHLIASNTKAEKRPV